MPSIATSLEWFKGICDDPYTGYSMDFRCGEKKTRSEVAGKTFTYASNYANDFTGDRYNATLTYYDCSSAVYYALLNGGWDGLASICNNYPFTTDWMRSALTSLGFVEVTGTNLKAGDIAWKSGHTAMVSRDGGGYVYEAHGRNSGGYTPFLEQVRESQRSDFSNYYRASDGGEPYTPVEVNLYVVAALCGNFYQESGINPGRWQIGSSNKYWTALGVGFGLGQWTNTGGDTTGRLYKLYNWLTNNGYAYDSGDGQMKYLFEEKVWVTEYPSTGYSYNYGIMSFDEFVQSSSEDLSMLTHAWNACWEGIKDESWDLRVEYAQKCYDYIKEHKDDENITQWYAGDYSLGESEILNNAVMVYRAFYNQFNEYGYSSNNGGGQGNNADRGDGKTDPDTVTFDDFLMAMLGHSDTGGSGNIHIKNKPRGKD